MSMFFNILTLIIVVLTLIITDKISKVNEEQHRLIESLKITINSLEEELCEDKQRINYYLHDLEVMLKNSKEQREKIKDLENNIELLVADMELKKELANENGTHIN